MIRYDVVVSDDSKRPLHKDRMCSLYGPSRDVLRAYGVLILTHCDPVPVEYLRETTKDYIRRLVRPLTTSRVVVQF